MDTLGKLIKFFNSSNLRRMVPLGLPWRDLTRRQQRRLRCLLGISMVLAVWSILSWKFPDPRRYPFEQGTPRGWYWADGLMSLPEFFAREGIDPRSLGGIMICAGADDFPGPATKFDSWLRSRTTETGLKEWTEVTYLWDAESWPVAAAWMESRRRTPEGLVVLIYPEGTTRALMPQDFPGCRGRNEYWCWSWKSIPRHTGVWGEIDARYGAVYGIANETFHDISPDGRDFKVTLTDARGWAREINEQQAKTPQRDWPPCFIPRGWEKGPTGFNISADNREAAFATMEGWD